MRRRVKDTGPGERERAALPSRRDEPLPAGADAVVVGAGIVGTAVAARLAAAGCDVCVLDRSSPAAGSSSSGEGNILLSDKLPGPDLELARRGVALWHEVAEESEARGEDVEFGAKGGLVVAHDAAQLAGLHALAAAQRDAGARTELLTPEDLASFEPMLARGLAGGVWYPEDCQVQPMLAVASQVAATRARAAGASFADTDVLACRLGNGGRIVALETTRGELRVGLAVVNAAGPWSGELAALLGSGLPVVPRRGHVLVTEPLSGVTPHKVYEAGYVGSIHDDHAGWSCSSVVESTASGTMLLGSSREFAGWSRRSNPAIVAAIAARAVVLFPVMASVRLLRSYVGFRPATPDRLPAIGWDRAVGGLLHATGHEGAGVGLCQVTAEAVECLLLGRRAPLDLAPFSPARFVLGEDVPPAGIGS